MYLKHAHFNFRNFVLNYIEIIHRNIFQINNAFKKHLLRQIIQNLIQFGKPA